jgi:hypothetical protein
MQNASNSVVNHPSAEYIYVVETTAGVKLGYSKDPLNRVNSYHGSANGLFRSWISNPLLNGRRCESLCHGQMSYFRQSGEFFDLPFDEVVACGRSISSNFEATMEQLDEKHKTDSEHSAAMFDRLQQVLMSGLPRTTQETKSEIQAEILNKFVDRAASVWADAINKARAEGWHAGFGAAAGLYMREEDLAQLEDGSFV